MTTVAFDHGITKEILDTSFETRGEKVTFDRDCTVTGLYVYYGASTAASYPRLYRVSDGALLSAGAAQAFNAGWNVVDLPDVDVSAGAEYVVAMYHADAANTATYETRSRGTAHSHAADSLTVTLDTVYYSISGDNYPGNEPTNSGAEWNFGLVVTIKPPGDPVVTDPNGGETLSDNFTITWLASNNPDGRSVTYDVDLTTDGGSTWSRIGFGIGGTSYIYDFTNEPATSAARVRVRAWDGALVSAWDESDANFTIQHNRAPLAPILDDPDDGSQVDLAAGYTFRWTPQDPDAGDSMSGWAFRRKVDTASTYEFWNHTQAAWQSTEIFNSGSTAEVTFAPGNWVNDTVYNWSVATKDNAGEIGPYASDSTVTAGKAPSAEITSPTNNGSVTSTTQPVFAHTYFDNENDPQATFQYRVFDVATYSDAAFDPATSTSVWDSGVVLSATQRDIQCGVPLEQKTYRVYLQVSQDGGATSGWTNNTFSVSLDAPAIPTITATPDPDAGRVILDVQGRDNLLDTAPASGEGSALVTGNTVTGPDVDGYYTLSTDGTNPALFRFYGSVEAFTSGIRTYTVSVDLRNTTAATVAVTPDVNDTPSGAWLVPANSEGRYTATIDAGDKGAPSIYHFADLEFAAGDQIDVRNISVRAVSMIEWTRGGLAPLSTFGVERSDDGGNTWSPVRFAGEVPHDGAATQQATVYDHEYVPNIDVQYRAKTTAEVEGGALITSASSDVAEANVEQTQWWLKSPTDDSLNMVVKTVGDGLEIDAPEVQGEFVILGREDPVIVSDVILTDRFTIEVLCVGQETYDALRALRARQETLLLQSDMGDQWYVRLGKSRKTLLRYTGNRRNRPVRVVPLPCVEVAKP